MIDLLLLVSVFLLGTLVGVLATQNVAKKVAKRIIEEECDKRGI
jgi:hypothetical protein